MTTTATRPTAPSSTGYHPMPPGEPQQYYVITFPPGTPDADRFVMLWGTEIGTDLQATRHLGPRIDPHTGAVRWLQHSSQFRAAVRKRRLTQLDVTGAEFAARRAGGAR